jgi:hypothetical protein
MASLCTRTRVDYCTLVCGWQVHLIYRCVWGSGWGNFFILAQRDKKVTYFCWAFLISLCGTQGRGGGSGFRRVDSTKGLAARPVAFQQPVERIFLPPPPRLRVNRRAYPFGRYKNPRRPHPLARESRVSHHLGRVSRLTDRHSPSPTSVHLTNYLTF